MIGILIVTHANLGDALADTIEFILGSRPDKMDCISIDIKEDAESLRKKISAGIKSVTTEKGVVIFTDMFGGTPSNLSYSFLEEGRIEVISGINLPILMKAVNIREKMDITQMTSTLVEHGKRSISLASEILRGSKRE